MVGSSRPGSRGLPGTLLVAFVLTTVLASGALPSPVRAQQAPPQFPVKDFFANPERAYFRLSDDGRTLGFMQPVASADGGRRLNVFVQPLQGSRLVGTPRQLTNETARDISLYYWKGNNTVLYDKDFGGDENFHVVAVDVKSGRVNDLTPGEKIRASILDILLDDPNHILVSHNQRDARVFDVYRVDVRTGKQTMIAKNPGNITGWMTDHAGRLRAAFQTEGLTSTVLYRPDEKSAFKPIITTDYRTEVEPAFFTFDNRQLYAISNRGRDKKALVVIDPAKPDAETVLFAHADVDLTNATYSRLRKKLATAEYSAAKPERKIFDPQTRTLFERLGAKLPGYELVLQSNTKAETKYIVAAFNDRTPGGRYLYDQPTDSITKLGDINPKLPADAMAAMKPVSYTSRDGLTINGYLTLPVGRDPKNLPCVVHPHGGPWFRDTWGYDPEVQFLANRGLCVLQMNFRGSVGYGRAFWEASFGQWGLRMQDDITDGAQWLVAQGVADPKRIAIYGASYGGYATLAGVTSTPDLYAAAVDYVGVSNLFTFMETIPPYWKPMLPKFYDMVGDPQKDAERLRATSPVFHADRIKTPLLIVQGARDPRVNKNESDQMVAALKERGVDVQYLVKDNEGHGFRNEENQFEFYGKMEEFLRQHLAPEAISARQASN